MIDERKHYIISMVKSVVRLLGYLVLLYSVPVAVLLLVMSEALGIVEENVHATPTEKVLQQGKSKPAVDHRQTSPSNPEGLTVDNV
jgi:hypothetical protein